MNAIVNDLCSLATYDDAFVDVASKLRT